MAAIQAASDLIAFLTTQQNSFLGARARSVVPEDY